ncbi:hypothetical protein [Spirosoma gilvum]
MNTEQSYVGRGTFATQPTPTAQKVAQTASTADNLLTPIVDEDWRDDFLRKVATQSGSKEYLFYLLESIREQMLGKTNVIPIITEIVSDCIIDRDYTSSQKKRKLSALLSLVGFMSELREYFECFDIESNYIKAANAQSCEDDD